MRLGAAFVLLAICSFMNPSLIAQMHGDHPPASLTQDLGSVEFANSGAEEAQSHFLRGLLLLHSFEYASARESFRLARETDPGFALAYWGEAMTHNHPIWGEQDKAAAMAVLTSLGASEQERLAKAPTAREKEYLRAIHVLYGTGSKRERDAAYSEAMERLAARYPDDLDARAFHALSLLGLTGAERDVTNYMRAAAVAEEIYEVNPRHPGALHYLIHAYDDPTHAPLGLRAARRYGKVAPAASHAQHMPSHIFFALGMWDESIEANIASMRTARDAGAGGYHPLHWLAYAYLQQGRRDEAAALVQTVMDDVAAEPTVTSRAYLAALCATWLVETGARDRLPCDRAVDRTGVTSIEYFAGHELARGLAALDADDRDAASAALGRLQEMIREARPMVGDDDGANRIDHVSRRELALAELMETELRAALLFAEGKREEALRLSAEAAEAEDELVFEYGPPPAFKPPHELHAELLLRAGRAEEAQVHFEKALERTPGRRASLASAVPQR